jgi:hypothetical protein
MSNVARGRPCSQLFSNPPQIWGEKSSCRIQEDDINIAIRLGKESTIQLGDQVTLAPTSLLFCADDEAYASGSANLEAGSLDLPPVVSLFGSIDLGLCDDLNFRAEVRNLGSIEGEYYRWSFSSNLQWANKTQSPDSFTVPSSHLVPGSTYTISMTVTNFLNQSHTATRHVTKRSLPAPAVQLRSAERQKKPSDHEVQIAIQGEAPSCGDELRNR